MEPIELGGAVALALVLARVIEKLVEHLVAKRKNGSGEGGYLGNGRSTLAKDERDMLRSIFEWKDRAERHDQEMLEKMTLISVSCKATADALVRVADRLDSCLERM